MRRNNNNNNVRRRVGKNTRNRPQQTNNIKSRVGINLAGKNPRQNWVQPEFRMQKFKFQADFGNITNSGSAYAGKMLYANNLYDPDPAILTSSVAGYTDNMNFYFYCLPVTVNTKVVLTNREAFPVKCCVLFSIQQADTLFSSTQNIIDLGENPISTEWHELSSAGGQDRATLRLKVNLARANGNEFEYNGNAQSYSCQPTSGPPFPMFMSVLVYSSSNNFTSSGVGVSWTMKWDCRLWSRRLIIDSGPTALKKQLLDRLQSKEKELTVLKDRILVIQGLADLDEAHAKIYGQLQEDLLNTASTIDKIKAAIGNPYQLLDL